jgi:serine/threonine-protein kinase
VADAMKYAWDTFGVVHCDLKPENIMVDRDGTIKVTDLGLCQSTAAIQNKEQPSEVVGSPAYISPEQIYGDVELDCRADIYSLGATLYHLTTGRMLFPIMSNDDILRAHVDPQQQAPDPRAMAPLLTEGFVRLMAGMLVKERDQRYQTWDDVFNDARIVEEGGTLPPLPEDTVSSILLNTP